MSAFADFAAFLADTEHRIDLLDAEEHSGLTPAQFLRELATVVERGELRVPVVEVRR